jgi:hypothetical protein
MPQPELTSKPLDGYQSHTLTLLSFPSPFRQQVGQAGSGPHLEPPRNPFQRHRCLPPQLDRQFQLRPLALRPLCQFCLRPSQLPQSLPHQPFRLFRRALPQLLAIMRRPTPFLCFIGTSLQFGVFVFIALTDRQILWDRSIKPLQIPVGVWDPLDGKGELRFTAQLAQRVTFKQLPNLGVTVGQAQNTGFAMP